MVPLVAAASLAKAGFQAYQSVRQKKLADKLKPSNYVPPAVEEALTNSRMAANASVAPGYGRTLDKLRTSTANTIGNATRLGNPNTIQATVSGADAREKEIIKDLEVSNTANQQNNRDKMNQFLQLKGGYQRQSWDSYNQAKSALKGASGQNAFNAITGLAEDAINIDGISKMNASPEVSDPTVSTTPSAPFKMPSATKVDTSATTNAVKKKYGYGATKNLLYRNRGGVGGFDDVAEYMKSNNAY